MANSFAETADFTCHNCNHPFAAEVWLIVDTGERPDLLARLRAGALHALRCPQCGDEGAVVDAPLVVYTPTGGEPPAPRLIFSPAQQTTAEQDREHAGGLLRMLAGALGDAWQDEWLQRVATVARRRLPVVLSDDPQAALEELRQRDPALWQALQEPAGAADDVGEEGGPEEGSEQPPLGQLLEQFVNARSWDQSQRLVEQHRELLGEEADAMLVQALAHWQEQGQSDTVAVLGEHRGLLRRCREVGSERAFAEKMLGAEGLRAAEAAGETPEAFLAARRDARRGRGESAQSYEEPPEAARPLLQELQRLNGILQMSQRVQVCRQLLLLLDREAQPRLWAAVQGELGNSLAQDPRGDRAENLERAIAGYEGALEVRTREAMPVEWATTTTNLATAYLSRIRGDRAENLERAIAEYAGALEVRTREAMPVEWATTTTNLATAYWSRIRGDRAENLERAIAGYEGALQVMTREAMPVEWAQTTTNLANAWSDRIRGDRAENLERAIAGYEGALQVMTREAMPVEWATTTMNLANAYWNRIRGDRAENLERAIAGYEGALQVMTREALPVEWAQTTMNLANAWSDRIRGDRAENLEGAIAGYEAALEVRTREAMPVEWATTTTNLATAYWSRIRGDRAENLERAIAGYEGALQVMTREAMPVEWAQTTMNLANAWSDRIRGDRAENLERAIAGYEGALEVRTREAMPVAWAQTTMNLANAYLSRIRGDRAENLERAIAGYEGALEVRTREAMPVEWAQTTTNLATAWSDRIRGDRAENLERAIAGYEGALQVMTREAMPVEWATTTMNLANAWSDRIRGDRAENLERAIAGYEGALQVMTREAMPVEWATTTMNLANAYRNRIRGDRAENLERAIAEYAGALEVRTREAMPVEWATTTTNLATAYWSRIRGDRAENLERAIAGYEGALQVMTREAMPVEWAQTTMNLANAWSDRIRGDRAENLERAIAGYEQALQVMTLNMLPSDFRKVSSLVGRLLLELQRPGEAVTHLRGALDASRLLYEAAATPEARQAVLRALGDAPAMLAFALVQASPSGGRSAEQAVEQVDANRARWLAEATALAAGKPQGASAAAWQAYQAAAAAVRGLEAEARLPEGTPSKRSFLELSTAMAAARRELAQAVEAVRGEDPAFLPAPAFAQVAAAVPGGSALAYVLAAPAGGLALIVRNGAAEAVPLPALTEPRVREWLVGPAGGRELGGWLGAYENWQRAPGRQSWRAWQSVMDETLAALGEAVAQPLHGALRRQQPPAGPEPAPAVTLVPTGLLALLPLHAASLPVEQEGAGGSAGAGATRRTLGDEYAVRYAPSAQALGAALRRDAAFRNGAAGGALLAVDEPQPITRGGPLPNSGREVAAAAEYFAEARVLRHGEATRAAVLQALPGAGVAHFSCHGGNDWRNPLASGLLMAHDEMLAVRDLLALQLPPARLAVLSACETGIVGADLPDEVVMLPTALLQAGFAGVVGSLWSVADASTAMLMVRFYDLWRREGLAPAHALRGAQQWVRDTTNAAKAAYFRAGLPAAGGVRMPAGVAAEFFDEMLDRRPHERDFAHPYWWAGFYLTGV